MSNKDENYCPRTVFLSGGSALRGVSACLGYYAPTVEPKLSSVNLQAEDVGSALINLHHNSTHLITCFDSGGSSYTLRKSHPGLPAVGDLRNRLCSLAQGHLKRTPANSVCSFQLYRVFTFRFPTLSKEKSITEVTTTKWIQALVHKISIILKNDICDIDPHREEKSVSLAWYLYSILPKDETSNSRDCTEFPGRLPPLHSHSAAMTVDPSESNVGQCHYQQLANILNEITNRLAKVPSAALHICATYLLRFVQHLPADFTLDRASLGNLVITGAYLFHNCDLVMAIDAVRVCLGVDALVLPTSVDNYTLGAYLCDGRLVIGQHALTTKKNHRLHPAPRTEGAVREIFLVDMELVCNNCDTAVASFRASEVVQRVSTATAESVNALAAADIICYSVGSFYTSLIASILPRGIGTAIFNNVSSCRVFVPNMLDDPEMVGISLHDAVKVLCDTLARDVMTSNSPESTHSADVAVLDTVAYRDVVSVVLINESSTYSQYSGSKMESLAIISNNMKIRVVEDDICAINPSSGMLELSPEKFLRALKLLVQPSLATEDINS